MMRRFIAATLAALTMSALAAPVAHAAPVCGEDVSPLDLSPAYVLEHCPDWASEVPGWVVGLVFRTIDDLRDIVEEHAAPATCVASLGLGISVNGVLECASGPSEAELYFYLGDAILYLNGELPDAGHHDDRHREGLDRTGRSYHAEGCELDPDNYRCQTW